MHNKLKNYLLVTLSVIVVVGFLGVGNLPTTVAHTSDTAHTHPEELKRTIDERTKELNAINAQIEVANANISALQGQKRTLNNEIRGYEQNINQIELNIRASEVTLEKLSLELESLNLDLENIISDIASKKEAIAETIRILQRKDREGVLHIFLKSQSLVEGAFEVQSIRDMQDVLFINVNDLGNLQEEMSRTIEETEENRLAMIREGENLRNRRVILDDQKSNKNQLLSQVANKESLFQEQLSELEEQQHRIDRELADIEEQLRLAFDPSLLPTPRSGVLGKPCDVCTLNSRVLTQPYGYVGTAFANRAYRGGFHNGIDWGFPTGTPIYAAEDGVVAAVDNNDRSAWEKYQYGGYVLIEHNNNLSTLYAHLSRPIVSVGSTVSRGQVIGYSGNTGFSTGPHLHFTVYLTPPLGWREVVSRNSSGGLIRLPPAAGLVPIGPTVDPADYL